MSQTMIWKVWSNNVQQVPTAGVVLVSWGHHPDDFPYYGTLVNVRRSQSCPARPKGPLQAETTEQCRDGHVFKRSLLPAVVERRAGLSTRALAGPSIQLGSWPCPNWNRHTADSSSNTSTSLGPGLCRHLGSRRV